jgi:hypothetical protein
VAPTLPIFKPRFAKDTRMSTSVPRRSLGRQGLTVSAIGLGCMGMSDFYGPADDATSLAVLHHALDIGVNFLDTADMYGVGANERCCRSCWPHAATRWSSPPSSATCAHPMARRWASTVDLTT